MPLKRIRLELARTRTFPDGSRSRGYEFTLPLKADGHIDADAWPAEKSKCRVRRFWEGEDDRIGEIHHTRHRTWAFSYVPGEADDEHFYHLETHVFRVGEYISIREPDGETYPFKVMSVV